MSASEDMIFGKNCVTEMCEKELPAEYHGNWKLEEHDANEVRMGGCQLKNISV